MNNVRHKIKWRKRPDVFSPADYTRPFEVRLPIRRQSGAVAVMFALTLLVILGIFGLTIDLGRLYNRKIEMQTLSDGVALAAARQLDGTAQGITNAINRANIASQKIKYDYDLADVVWSSSAIQFSASSRYDGNWLSADEAFANPQNVLYVKVDTNSLPSQPDTIRTSFIRVLPFAPTSARASARAIVGPSSISVTPFAICAMSPNAAEPRANPASAGPPAAPANTELVQYGFRRGVGYDLMKLNPTPGATNPLTFIVNPVAPPNTVGLSNDMTDAKVGPFLCAGKMAMSRVTGGPITVRSQFPLATLFDRFNSRFDDYGTGQCDPWTAPPDTNVRSYDRTVVGNVPWMTPTTGPQTAQSTTAGGKMWTVADPVPNATTDPKAYGVLWAFAKAVPYASYVAGLPEPTGGYTTFTTAAWNTLYDPGRPAPVGTLNSGASTPYANGAIQLPTPANRPGIRQRRVLNVPLLACPVAGSSATVIGIGKFFMTTPATATSLNAEFAGLAAENSLTSTMELLP